MLGEMSGTQKSQIKDHDSNASSFDDGTTLGVPQNSYGTMKQTFTNAPDSMQGIQQAHKNPKITTA
jgi:hypothetical protein